MLGKNWTFFLFFILSHCISVVAQERADEAIANGESIYQEHCAWCHSARVVMSAPPVQFLSAYSPEAILYELNTGKMTEQSEALSQEERRTVAEWISQKQFTALQFPQGAYCSSRETAKISGVHASGWGGQLEGNANVEANQAGLTSGNVDNLELKWAFSLPGVSQVRSRPAIAGQILILASHAGDVFGLDKDNGCIYWHFKAQAGIRGAVSIERNSSGIFIAYWVDENTNVYAVAAATGELIWMAKHVGEHRYASNTGSVAVYDGLVYVPISSREVFAATSVGYNCCTASGEIVALDAKNGSEVWRFRTVDRAVPVGSADNPSGYAPSGAPVWSSPTVDAKRGLLYFGTGENYSHPTTDTSDAIIALNLKSGELAWVFQAIADDAFNMACLTRHNRQNCPDPEGPDSDFGMAPLIVSSAEGKQLLVVGQKSGDIYALDPDAAGKLIWKQSIGIGGGTGGVHWGLAADGQKVYAPISDRFTNVGQRKADPAPGVHALELSTGKPVWYAVAPEEPCNTRKPCYAANSGATSVAGDVVFAGGLDGYIRAYGAKDGSLLWQYDTVKKYTGINGVPGQGGALDGPSALVHQGMVYVNSGYGRHSQLPGNVFLAFELSNKE